MHKYIISISKCLRPFFLFFDLLFIQGIVLNYLIEEQRVKVSIRNKAVTNMKWCVHIEKHNLVDHFIFNIFLNSCQNNFIYYILKKVHRERLLQLGIERL